MEFGLPNEDAGARESFALLTMLPVLFGLLLWTEQFGGADDRLCGRRPSSVATEAKLWFVASAEDVGGELAIKLGALGV